ncbi:MAG: methionine aminopeptidase [Intrasporangium sp.]|nr:methionine aminopeptidase [Intrasporangium sp.]MDN5796384.1 methionine aminopeptidase [Intrasporangium sp.]
MKYWYNVKTGEIQTDETRSRGEVVLGPYDSEAEARKALQTAKARTQAWDEQDREWNGKGASPGWSDDENQGSD